MGNNTKKGKKKTTSAGRFQRLRKFFTGERFKYTVGLFLFILALYLLIAFISFLIYGSVDESKLDLSWHALLKNASIQVQNKAGKTGAFLSERIINRGFGIASFLFIYLLVISAFKCWGRQLVRYWPALVYSLVLVGWLSLCLGLLLPDLGNNSFIYLSGATGYVMAGWLNSLLGSIGTFFLLLFSLFLILLIRFENFLGLIQHLFHFHRKRHAKPEPVVAGRQSPSVNTNDGLEPDPVFAKTINENNLVETVFDPDAEAPDEPKISGNNDHMDEFSEEEEAPMAVGVSSDKEPDENLELTVEKIQEDTDENFVQQQDKDDYDPTQDLSDYSFPTIDLLDDHQSDNVEVSNEELLNNKNKIVETLRQYKIEIVKIRATIGPTITLYEIVPAPGVRIAKIKNLEDDIALSLAALGIRIIAPIPGRGTIGIEVPNQSPEIVSMRSIIASRKFQESKAELPVVLGKTISNETFLIDLAKMPHILVAGATGQGKSVGLNAIISSLLYKKHPSQLKLVLIDPKKVELSLYSNIEKHFLAKLPDEEEPIITDIQKVKYTLNSLNIEMDNRYDLLKKAHARNIKEYNSKFVNRRLNPEKGHRYLPYIVVIIDEFADLIMTAGKEIELPIARIAQLARAVGIHMVIATQRPSTNIITGVIKANFPTRIAFKVASMVDSRTILDTPGANQLIGKGDMLIAMGSNMTRLQCAFVDTPEVERICEFIGQQRGYPSAFLLPDYVGEDSGNPLETDLKNRDELFNDAARIVVMNQMGSTSMIQRKFSIGYNRAGRIMDQLEAAGIVGPSEGSKARQVLIQDEYSLEQLLNTI